MSTQTLDSLSGEPQRDFDPKSPLTATGNLRRRQITSLIVDNLSRISAAIAVLALLFVTYTVVERGRHAISWTFLTKAPAAIGSGGGIGPEILGTATIVVISTIIATPIGVLTAIYLTEFASPKSRVGQALTLGLNLLQGLPTIVIGIVIYGLLVQHSIVLFGLHLARKGYTGLAGAIALSLIELPLIARTSQEVLLRVPGSLREAGDALGVERWRTIVTVILPTAAGGILTGTILAVARAAGETAPLLLCDQLYNASHTSVNISHALPNIPLTIFMDTNGQTQQQIQQAWGAALVLFGLIVIANIAARVLLARSRKRTGT